MVVFVSNALHEPRVTVHFCTFLGFQDTVLQFEKVKDVTKFEIVRDQNSVTAVIGEHSQYCQYCNSVFG